MNFLSIVRIGICTVISNLKITKNVNLITTSNSDIIISCRNCITFRPNNCTCSVNFNSSNTLFGSRSSFQICASSDIEFIELIYVDTCVCKSICRTFILLNPFNLNYVHADSCLTKSKIDIIGSGICSNLHYKVNYISVDNHINNFFRCIGRCNLSLNNKVACGV